MYFTTAGNRSFDSANQQSLRNVETNFTSFGNVTFMDSPLTPPLIGKCIAQHANLPKLIWKASHVSWLDGSLLAVEWLGEPSNRSIKTALPQDLVLTGLSGMLLLLMWEFTSVTPLFQREALKHFPPVLHSPCLLLHTHRDKHIKKRKKTELFLEFELICASAVNHHRR